MSTSKKAWWGRVWPGLVVDPDGKHVRRLKAAFPLLIYLIVHADWDTGLLRRTHRTIAREMGLSLWTVRAWMRRLDRHGYVRLTKTGRASIIEVLKWRPVGHGAASLAGTAMPVRQAGLQRPPSNGRPGSQERRGETQRGSPSNESLMTRVIERESVVRKFPVDDSAAGRDGEEQQARIELLAHELADGLGDRDHLARYRTHARRFPEHLLRRLLSEARAAPEHRIKRSKAALFEYLLKQYVLSTTPTEPCHSRD